MEFEVSLPFLQEPATYSCRGPYQSIATTYYLYEIHFNIILPYTPRFCNSTIYKFRALVNKLFRKHMGICLK